MAERNGPNTAAMARSKAADRLMLSGTWLNRAIRFLDSGMRLVDAGDYDRDGKSELLFSINRYGIGWYELLLR